MLFAMGLVLQGRLFPFDLSEPLVALAAFANAGLGLPWVVGRMLGLGGGVVTAVTYEYGNSFLIVAGLLNFLVILDAFDIAVGRKWQPPPAAGPLCGAGVAVFAALARDEPREQLRTGAMMFGGFVAAAVVLGWLIYPLGFESS